MLDFNDLPAQDRLYYLDAESGIAIYCADCREILPLFPDKSFDLVLTDPPYGFGISKLSWGDNGYSKISEIWDELDNDWLGLVKARSILCFMGYKGLGEYLSKGRELNYKLNDIIVWDKINTMPNITARGYQFTVEFLIWWTTESNWEWNAKQKRDILRFTWSQGNDKRCHPSEKPTSIINDILVTHSNQNSLILDPFLGSGTTAVCAKKLGRKCVGIEISEEYCAIAVKRLSQSVMQFNEPQNNNTEQKSLI